MIYAATGQAAPGLFVLGSPQVPVYLVDGPWPVLIDAGFACLAPLYERDARRFLGGREPAWLLLTHSHFDHCGAAAWLKGAFPGMGIAASARAAEILARPNALDLIARLSAEAAQAVKAWGYDPPAEAAFAPFAVDRVLGEGDTVDLGDGRALRALAAPGHTWDFLSYFEPAAGILIASEAVGCADGSGQIIAEFLVDYDAYEASLMRLTGLDPRVVAPGHRHVYTGEDAPAYLERSLQAAREFKQMVEDLLVERRGDLEQVIGLVKARQYDPVPGPKQPEGAYLINLGARVRCLAARLARRKEG